MSIGEVKRVVAFARISEANRIDGCDQEIRETRYLILVSVLPYVDEQAARCRGAFPLRLPGCATKNRQGE